VGIGKYRTIYFIVIFELSEVPIYIFLFYFIFDLVIDISASNNGIIPVLKLKKNKTMIKISNK
jgi:hypothetical protein